MKSRRLPHILLCISRISPDFRKIYCDLEERAVSVSENEGEESREVAG